MKDQPMMMNPSQVMNQQPQLLNPAPPMINQQPPMLSQAQIMSQPPPMVHHPQAMKTSQLLGQSQVITQPQMMMNLSQQPPMMNRPYKVWSKLPVDPNTNMIFQSGPNPNFGTTKQGRSNWNIKKKGVDKRKDSRRMEKPMPNSILSGPSGSGGYKPPTLHELQYQNRMKARKFYNPKKKFNNRIAPYAPRNTTSYIIRAKKSGGIASLVSPCPVTPAVLPTPIFSPSREVLGDMAKEEWGVDGYGSMKGLIRLRSPGNEGEMHEDEEDEEGGGSSESDVEEHVEVERRLDHDLSRFEMIYPNYGVDYNNVLENRVDDQDSHLVQLEEENLTLKERLFLMERELGDLRRRLQFLERQNRVADDVNEQVVENASDNESEGGSDVRGAGGDGNEEIIEYVSCNRVVENASFDANGENNEAISENAGVRDVYMEFVTEDILTKEGNFKDKQPGAEVVAEDNREELKKSVAVELMAEDTFKDEIAGQMCLDKSRGGDD